ncbi:thiol-activated cytolysin family protein [Pedobacter gandavensis]|uniref:thiol-activated cytolysin family protein n=1 Tax=Pedobacter gandavensis TaxID=2679963 RepID=UPI00292EC2E8|nr:thiol-activated cytolysin family protein [Pedobacter gandavensis]
MKKFIYCLAISLSVLNFSCQKDKYTSPSLDQEGDQKSNLLATKFKDLKVELVDPIVIMGGRSMEELLNARKQNGATLIGEYSSSEGLVREFESTEMIVTPDNETYIYPGSIIKSASIPSDDFAPLIGYKKLPIDVSTTFISDKSFGRILSPSLSQTRVFLRDALMDPSFSGNQLEEFSTESYLINSYKETKVAFGYNINEKRLFSSTNTSMNSSSSKITSKTGLILTYLVKNFTLSTPNPQVGEMVDYVNTPASVFQGSSPVYVNSVTYGRFGFLMVESESDSAVVHTTWKKVVKKLFRKSTETFSSDELKVFNSCKVTVYLLGSSLGTVTDLIINPGSYEALAGFFSDNLGIFTASDPGVPIQFSAKYLTNNMPYKSTFRIVK